MAHGHPQSDPQTSDHRLGSRHAGRTRRTRLIHTHCHRRASHGNGTQHFCPPASLQGLLEPVAWKRARPVLRGPRRSNAPGLPDEIYFSILQRKALTPNNFDSLDHLAQRITTFETHYNRTATPFDWRFTRTDLHHLLTRLAA